MVGDVADGGGGVGGVVVEDVARDGRTEDEVEGVWFVGDLVVVDSVDVSTVG